MKFLPLFCLAACIVLSFAESKYEKCLPDHEVVKKMMTGYDKVQAPKGVVDVEITMWLQDIEEICSKKGVATLSLYMNGLWTDERLNFEKLNPCNKNITLTKEKFDELWNPRIVVTGSRKFSIYETPIINFFTFIFENGTIWTNYRAKLDTVCSFESKDKAQCTIDQESFVGNVDHVKLHWSPNPFMSIVVDTENAPWKLTGHQTKQWAPVYPAGQWSTVSLLMDFMKTEKEMRKEELLRQIHA